VAFLYPEQLILRAIIGVLVYETGRIARSIALGKGFGNPLFEERTDRMDDAGLSLSGGGVFKIFGIYTKCPRWSCSR